MEHSEQPRRGGQYWPAIRRIATPVGWSVVGLALLGLAIGWIFSWIEAVAVGLTALICALVGLLFLIGRNRFEVSLALAGNRVVVGDRAAGQIVVRNKGSRSAMPVNVELPVGKGVAMFAVPRLRGGDTHEEIYTIPTGRRAVIDVGPVRTVRSDPIGMFRREVAWGDQQQLYVHPRTIALDKVTAGFLRDLDGRPVPDLSDSDVAFHALREYTVGDDRRSVHWRATAHSGTLMVRQYEETRRWHLAVALSTSRAEYLSDEEFELAVGVAGSLGVHAIVDGRELTVLTHDQGLHTMSPTRLLDQLSGVETSTGKATVVTLAQDVATEAPNASIVVLIVGGGVEITHLTEAQSRLPIGAMRIAVWVKPGEPPTRRRIGDLVVLTIGTLAELPRALRSTATAGV